LLRPLEQRRRREDHPRGAEAALRAILLVEGGLDPGHVLRGAQPLERGDRRAVQRGERGQAGAPRLAVDQNGAGPAAALLAAGLGAGDSELLAENVEQRGERRAGDLVREPVDVQLHQAPTSASARETSTGSIRSRYQADASASS